jgi:hypothetical protein
MTTTATLRRPLDPSPDLYGHHPTPVPAGCVLVSTGELAAGDVLQHAEGTFDLVISITALSGAATAVVHVLRTMPNGRTTGASFWIGEHARRTVHRVVQTPADLDLP